MKKLKAAFNLFWLMLTADEYFYYFEKKGRYYDGANIQYYKIKEWMKKPDNDYNASMAVSDLKEEIGL